MWKLLSKAVVFRKVGSDWGAQQENREMGNMGRKGGREKWGRGTKKMKMG